MHALSKPLTEVRELLERRRRQVDVVVAAGIAAIDDPDSDRLAVPSGGGRLSASGAVVRVAVCARHQRGPDAVRWLYVPGVISPKRDVPTAATHS